MQAGILLQEKSLDYLIIEKTSEVGAHWTKYPRHRGLISINKRYTGSSDPDFNLRHDWNSLLTTNPAQPPFTAYTDELYPSADTLLIYLKDVATSHQLHIQYNTEASYIRKTPSGLFSVVTNNGEFQCKYLLIGMGGTPWSPEINGLNLPGIDTYETVSLDKSEFADKKVLILGKGNSAFECGEYLANTASVIHFISPRQISFAWNTHYVGDLRAVRNNLLDMYQLKSQHAILNGTISNIELVDSPQGNYKVDFCFSYTPDDPVSTIHYDKIIACTGFKYINKALFDEATVPVVIDERKILKGKFPKIQSDWQFVHVDNMYVIGAAMQTVSFRRNAGGFIHGFRYTIRTLINLLAEKCYSIPYPATHMRSVNHSIIADSLLSRMNTSSSLYQMYNELCDVVVESCLDSGDYIYYYDFPIGLLHRFHGSRFIIFTFNFGSREGVDAFTYVLQATPEHPEKSVFIHPVLRSFDPSGSVEKEIHLLENLESTWNDDGLHRKPLIDFLSSAFKPMPSLV